MTTDEFRAVCSALGSQEAARVALGLRSIVYINKVHRGVQTVPLSWVPRLKAALNDKENECATVRWGLK